MKRMSPPAIEDPTHEPPAAPALRAPGALRLLLEARAPWEYAALLAATPWLSRLPRGDLHPVIVYPGLGAADLSTLPLRRFLRHRGYTPYGWTQGLNLGPRRGVLEACRQHLQQVAERHDEPVSLIGWSLGGIYARELAKEMPDMVRSVVTLGTPFTGHPTATNAWRLYEMVSGQKVRDPALMAQIGKPPVCPTTSIYSKSDGVVAWQCSINPQQPHTENIEVRASHIGMGLNPLALYAIADRLAQRPEDWKRFDASGARRWFYNTGPQWP